MPDQIKNVNKLPEGLIQKLILYSSNPGDIVCDFFMGNFTTAYAAIKLGRYPIGFELNKNAFQHHEPLLSNIKFGCDLETLKKVEIIKPKNQGKSVTDAEKESIKQDYQTLLNEGRKKKDINAFLCKKYGRGRFSIKNILDEVL